MKIAGIYALIILVVMAGCTESTTVGGEILDQDQSALQAIDTLTIRTATISQDKLTVYSPTAQFNNNLCGYLEDPVFGTVKADFYAQFRVNQNALPVYPDTAKFDSLVLILEYDVEDIYGDSTAEQQFEIYRITNDPVDMDSVYASGDELPVESTPLATITFRPDLEVTVDSSTIIATNPDTTYATINPFLSIKLPEDLMMDLVDINTNNNDQTNEDFVANFGGLAIRPVGGPTRSMLSFNIGALRTGLQLHYSIGDEEAGERIYEYNITTASVKFSSFDSDFSSAITNAVADGFEGGKTQTYLQGMDGPNTLVQLPYITDFKDEVLVNHAELTVTIQDTPDSDLFSPVTQIIVLYEDQDGNFITVEDFLFTANGVGIGAFGGQPEIFTAPDGEMLSRYRMKLSGHLQRMIAGEVPNEIHLRVFQKNEKANRVVLYGAEHPQYPVTLKANFTNLN